MKKIMLPLTIGILAASVPVLANPGNGNGNGKNNGNGPSMAAAMKSNGNGNGNNNAKSGWNKAAEKAQKKSADFESAGAIGNALGNASKAKNNGNGNAKSWGNGNIAKSIDDKFDKSDWKRPERRDYNDDPLEIRESGRNFGLFDNNDKRGLIDGCPPGLAKKNNGCLPPGLAKKQNSDNWWNSYSRWDNGDYIYRDGYLLGLGSNGSVNRYLPLLGGALSFGSTFPDYYRSYPVSDYRARFYGDGNDDYIYRYSDGVIYALDPESYAISEIAGLLTGDDFTIGQPIPQGYSVYNVPYSYRDQYVDGPDGYYRYNDGYVYQVDPETQLILTAIQLLS